MYCLVPGTSDVLIDYKLLILEVGSQHVPRIFEVGDHDRHCLFVPVAVPDFVRSVVATIAAECSITRCTTLASLQRMTLQSMGDSLSKLGGGRVTVVPLHSH